MIPGEQTMAEGPQVDTKRPPEKAAAATIPPRPEGRVDPATAIPFIKALRDGTHTTLTELANGKGNDPLVQDAVVVNEDRREPQKPEERILKPVTVDATPVGEKPSEPDGQKLTPETIGTASVGDLLTLGRDHTIDAKLQRAALDELQKRFPERAEELMQIRRETHLARTMSGPVGEASINLMAEAAKYSGDQGLASFVQQLREGRASLTTYDTRSVEEQITETENDASLSGPEKDRKIIGLQLLLRIFTFALNSISTKKAA